MHLPIRRTVLKELFQIPKSKFNQTMITLLLAMLLLLSSRRGHTFRCLCFVFLVWRTPPQAQASMTCRTLGSLLHFQTVSELEFSLSQEALQVGQIRRQKAADMGDSNGLPRMELGPFVVSFEFHLGPMCKVKCFYTITQLF